MQEAVIHKDVCSGCGGSGDMPNDNFGDTTSCTMCGGTGNQVLGTFEIDIPTTAQFNSKFTEIETALQAIWNKVKDLT